MRAPQPIPYQGSKRALAPIILNYFPDRVSRLIEPFAGSAAITVAAAMKNKAKNYIINDINSPLIQLLREIVESPEKISSKYEELWNKQIGNEKEFFLKTRASFNKEHLPEQFLYVLARCIKGAVRYNSNGEFNQSADNRRMGKSPKNMSREISLFSAYLRGKTNFSSTDYFDLFKIATEDDLIYMDPPYQGTSNNKDPRYFSGLSYEKFVSDLEYLNNRNVPFIISYDGKTGEKSHGKDLPSNLKLHKIMIEVGRSTQATLLGNKDVTFEALYLSDSLVNKFPSSLPEIVSLKPMQLQIA